jgi:hypothetical protein
MYTPSQMRMLRISVVVMGVILLLGFATVIGRIVYLLNTSKPMEAQSQAAPEMAAPLKVPASVELPKGAVIKHLALSGRRLAIHYETASGAGIRIVDLAFPEQSVTLPIVEAAPQ